MTIIFTDEEREWIDKKPFDWSIKDGCPKEIEIEIKKKLGMLKSFANQNKILNE